jgi:hypothetical protein
MRIDEQSALVHWLVRRNRHGDCRVGGQRGMIFGLIWHQLLHVAETER